MATAWADRIISDVNEILQYGKIRRHRYNTAQRRCMKASTPLACLPCIVWSAIWRLIACPFVCMTYGGEYACGDNGCTSVSDACVFGCVTVIDEKDVPNPDEARMAYEQDRQEVYRAFAYVVKYMYNQDAIRYNLAAYIHPYVKAVCAAQGMATAGINNLPYCMIDTIHTIMPAPAYG